MKPTVRCVVAAVAVSLLLPVPAAAAHSGTGTEVTSNFRTRLTEVPSTPELDVDLVDISGTVRVEWTGRGVVVIEGYEGEPYLRLSAYGVERNLRSPATYLNEDRYARAAIPDNADPGASPEWELLADGRQVDWHDHRNHWMSPAEPPQVATDPSRRHVIIQRWQIPLSIDGQPAIIAGDLTWIPPPTTVAWLAAALGLAVLSAGLLFTRHWRRWATGLAYAAALVFTADTFGYFQNSADTLANRLFTFFFPALAVTAAIRIALHARRATPHPTLAMMGAGLVLTMIGGIDRLDALTNSQVFAGGPGWLPRIGVVTCLGVGAALIARFVPMLLRSRPDLPSPVTSPHEASA